jgi:uncharacterized membrane protein YhaH (DUF805 family)
VRLVSIKLTLNAILEGWKMAKEGGRVCILKEILIFIAIFIYFVPIIPVAIVGTLAILIREWHDRFGQKLEDFLVKIFRSY